MTCGSSKWSKLARIPKPKTHHAREELLESPEHKSKQKGEARYVGIPLIAKKLYFGVELAGHTRVLAAPLICVEVSHAIKENNETDDEEALHRHSNLIAVGIRLDAWKKYGEVCLQCTYTQQ